VELNPPVLVHWVDLDLLTLLGLIERRWTGDEGDRT
jgi:hypothetical protein